MCSATLIGDGFVITLAHCLLDHVDKQLSNDILLVGLGPVANETVYQVQIPYSILRSSEFIHKPKYLPQIIGE